jgi:hypothetical protein
MIYRIFLLSFSWVLMLQSSQPPRPPYHPNPKFLQYLQARAYLQKKEELDMPKYTLFCIWCKLMQHEFGIINGPHAPIPYNFIPNAQTFERFQFIFDWLKDLPNRYESIPEPKQPRPRIPKLNLSKTPTRFPPARNQRLHKL